MHHVIWQHMPTISLPDEIMWLRGAHGHNDSGAPGRKPMFDADEATLRQVLRKRFRIDLPALRAALMSSRAGGGPA